MCDLGFDMRLKNPTLLYRCTKFFTASPRSRGISGNPTSGGATTRYLLEETKGFTLYPPINILATLPYDVGTNKRCVLLPYQNDSEHRPTHVGVIPQDLQAPLLWFPIDLPHHCGTRIRPILLPRVPRRYGQRHQYFPII